MLSLNESSFRTWKHTMHQKMTRNHLIYQVEPIRRSLMSSDLPVKSATEKPKSASVCIDPQTLDDCDKVVTVWFALVTPEAASPWPYIGCPRVHADMAAADTDHPPSGAGPPAGKPNPVAPTNGWTRRDRPCDACRRRKSRCILLEGSESCVLCHSRSEECTFVQIPQRRKRRRDEESSEGASNPRYVV